MHRVHVDDDHAGEKSHPVEIVVTGRSGPDLSLGDPELFRIKRVIGRFFKDRLPDLPPCPDVQKERHQDKVDERNGDQEDPAPVAGHKIEDAAAEGKQPDEKIQKTGRVHIHMVQQEKEQVPLLKLYFRSHEYVRPLLMMLPKSDRCGSTSGTR